MDVLYCSCACAIGNNNHYAYLYVLNQTDRQHQTKNISSFQLSDCILDFAAFAQIWSVDYVVANKVYVVQSGCVGFILFLQYSICIWVVFQCSRFYVIDMSNWLILIIHINIGMMFAFLMIQLQFVLGTIFIRTVNRFHSSIASFVNKI